jgi:hypothetical protein
MVFSSLFLVKACLPCVCLWKVTMGNNQRSVTTTVRPWLCVCQSSGGPSSTARNQLFVEWSSRCIPSSTLFGCDSYPDYLCDCVSRRRLARGFRRLCRTVIRTGYCSVLLPSGLSLGYLSALSCPRRPSCFSRAFDVVLCWRSRGLV